jgi:hypothetical protein
MVLRRAAGGIREITDTAGDAGRYTGSVAVRAAAAASISRHNTDRREEGNVTDQAQQRAIQSGIAVVALFFLPTLGDPWLLALGTLVLLGSAAATLGERPVWWRVGLAAGLAVAVAAATVMLTRGAAAP